MGCFPIQPINPLNQALLSILGDNYFPSYAAQFQPTDRKKMTNDKFLQYQTPGGGKIKPAADGTHKNIGQILTSVTGLLGSVFNFFAPLFLILDLIRALIDIICAFFNPIPVILTIVELFITVIPPIIALYPPLSTILHALNAAKLIIAIMGSLGATVISITDQVVECGEALVKAGLEGDQAALLAIPLKICSLIQDFANELGGLAPISFILEILDFFLGLGAKLFCPSDAACCNEEFCPPIIVAPPSGTGNIVGITIPGYTIGDLVAPLREVVLDDFLGLPITYFDPPTTIPLNAISAGIFEDIEIGPIQFGPFGPLDLLPIPDIIADFRLTPPTMFLELINPPSNMSDLRNFIIHPDNLSSPADGTVPATIRMRVRRTDIPNQPFIAGAVTFYGPPKFEVSLGGLSLPSPDLGIPEFVILFLDVFPPGTPVEWELEPDIIELLKNNLIGLGCEPSIRSAADGVADLINESLPSSLALGNPVDNGFAPLGDKIGRGFPPPPITELEICIAAQEADPTVSQAQCVYDIVISYIDEVSEFTEDVICIGSSPTGSIYTVNRKTINADGKDFALIRLQINDIAGNQLLNGTLSDNFNVEFSTTFGTLGPVVFDRETSTFQTTLVSDTKGQAEISAAFLVRNIVCMRPANFDGFSVTEKVLTTDFIRPGGTYPRKRRENTYVQSRGRRR